MDNQTLVFLVVCILAIVFLFSSGSNRDKQKRNSSGRNNEVFNKENFGLGDGAAAEQSVQQASASYTDAVVYFRREDIAHLLEILEDVRRNVDDKSAEDISFDVNINNRHISIVIGGCEKEEKKE